MQLFCSVRSTILEAMPVVQHVLGLPDSSMPALHEMVRAQSKVTQAMGFGCL
jgi:hypothetical protein